MSSPRPAAATPSPGVRPALRGHSDTSCPAPAGSDTPASDWPPPDTAPASTNQRRGRIMSSDGFSHSPDRLFYPNFNNKNLPFKSADSSIF